MSGGNKKKINESAGERALFFAVANAGWKAYVRATGDAIAFEEWRKLETETLFGAGINSIKKLNQVDDFEKLMLHFAILAGNDALIAKFSRSEESRAKWLIKRCMAKIGEALKTEIGWGYVEGICARMRLPKSIDDCPAALLMKVYMALDMHRRRAVKAGAEVAGAA